MKHLFTILAAFLIEASTFAQTGIGTTAPHASAQLEVSSTTKGFLPPRMTTVQRDAIVNPATGLQIYNTTTNTLEYNNASGWVSLISNPNGVNAGEMQYWDGSNWVNITIGTEAQTLTIANGLPVWQTPVNRSLILSVNMPVEIHASRVSSISVNLESLYPDTELVLCWSTLPNPTTTDNVVTPIDHGEGAFYIDLSGLIANTTYYVRAHAINAYGATYSDEISFNTIFEDPPMQIGQPFLGGILAYVLQSGDSGYDPLIPHGLIATYSDLVTTSWAPLTAPDGNSTSLGSGAQNTSGIKSFSNGALQCSRLTLNGYSDWFLPSRDELIKVLLNRVAIGNFLVAGYWSSSDFSSTQAWHVFYTSSPSPQIKQQPFGIRAVRAF